MTIFITVMIFLVATGLWGLFEGALLMLVALLGLIFGSSGGGGDD